MARKPRIHYPGAVYHVILRGNGGQDIFFTKADRARFYFLLQEGVEKYGLRIHAFCLMSNHVHLAIQVGEVPLSRIMQNVGLRYTSYLNRRKKRTGHIFQGRYKALLIDADRYLLELVRYIHGNPVRAGLVQTPDQYPLSSHRAYLGLDAITWLSTEWVLSQFAEPENKARALYINFMKKGLREEHRTDFHRGSFEGRILGDDKFREKSLARAKEKFQCRLSVEQIVAAVCDGCGLNPELLAEPGKRQPAATGRAIAAYLVQDAANLTLTELSDYVRRDIAALSRAAERLRVRVRSDPGLAIRIITVRQRLEQISKCQA
ncbi:MAG: transposase [Pseudomonadota bacterium]